MQNLAAKPGDIDISVIIKTFNEEKHIACTIESVLTALQGFNAEVIVADSQSTDQTAKIVQGYPVKLIILTLAHQRCCGIGPQMGFQHAHGEFIYLMDGDMESIPGFFNDAISRIRENPHLAGVAGIIEELGGGDNYEFGVRKTKGLPLKVPGSQRWLVGGGLYRKAAIDSVGYLSNRNLHANEEKELGLRLAYKGWQMERISTPALSHYGYSLNSIELMKARWKSGYVDGPGELFRSSLGTPYFWDVLKSQKKLMLIILVWLLLLSSMFISVWTLLPIKIVVLLIVSGAIIFIFSKRGFVKGILGLINHQVYAAGYLRGMLRKQQDPNTAIDCIVYTESDR